MYKYLLNIVMLLSIFILDITLANAHPGNTSWDGCHYCKTNCSKWGYTYGTRHCHNGGVPQFGVADPLYYYIDNTLNKQSACDKKYPGTTYQSNGDKCACSNGNEWSKVNKCNTIGCNYSDGTKAKIGDIASDGSACGSNGKWIDPNAEKKIKQSACDKKYPGTTYQTDGDKCICLNGYEWNNKTRSCSSSSNQETSTTFNTIDYARIGMYSDSIFSKLITKYPKKETMLSNCYFIINRNPDLTEWSAYAKKGYNCATSDSFLKMYYNTDEAGIIRYFSCSNGKFKQEYIISKNEFSECKKIYNEQLLNNLNN